MRDLFICAAAFSLSMALLSVYGRPPPAQVVEPERYTMMECHSLSDDSFDIAVDGGKYKAAGECFFGGYYTGGPTTEL